MGFLLHHTYRNDERLIAPVSLRTAAQKNYRSGGTVSLRQTFGRVINSLLCHTFRNDKRRCASRLKKGQKCSMIN